MFPKKTAGNKHLTELLKKAYIDTRYKIDGYSISKAEPEKLSIYVQSYKKNKQHLQRKNQADWKDLSPVNLLMLIVILINEPKESVLTTKMDFGSKKFDYFLAILYIKSSERSIAMIFGRCLIMIQCN